MPPLYKQKSKSRSQANIQCKDCGSFNTERMHRNLFEKILCNLTSGKYAYQKHYCKACDTVTYKSMVEAERDKQLRAERAKLV